MTGIYLANCGEIPELIRFQGHFLDFKIVVYDGLYCDSIHFECQVESPKRINLLFVEVNQLYHVIPNLTGAMAKRYVCRACNKGCRQGMTNICDQTCSDCMTSPSCSFVGVRIPCGECKDPLGASHVMIITKKLLGADKIRKNVCEQKKCYVKCGILSTNKKHHLTNAGARTVKKTKRSDTCVS